MRYTNQRLLYFSYFTGVLQSRRLIIPGAVQHGASFLPEYAARCQAATIVQ